MINLNGQRVVIVGGGQVAEKRVQTLSGSGANITVISPKISGGIHAFWKRQLVIWKQKEVEVADLQEAFLIIIATNYPDVNTFVQNSSPHGVLVNMAVDAEKGNTSFPSIFRRGRLQISISTSGASPLLAAEIKRDLEATYDENYGEYIDFLYESRQLIKQMKWAKEEQKKLLRDLLSDVYLHKDKQKQMIRWLENVKQQP